MKHSFKQHRKLWISIIAAILVIAIVVPVVIGSFGDKQGVSTKIDLAEAQKIVDETFESIPKSTASGANYILDNTKVTVNSITYGQEKDIILSCSYTALNVEDVINNNIDKIMCDVYNYYLANENAGKRTNATKINLEFKKSILTYLESAQQVSGEVTLYIYETDTGLELYLSDEAVDAVTGGLISASATIKSTTSVNFICEFCGYGETIDITNKNTLRTGILDCLALENYDSDRPVTGGALERLWTDFADEFYRNFIERARWKYLVEGLGTTLAITCLSALMGILLGIVIALIRCTRQMTGKLKFADAICKIYLTVFRGTPVMVQLLILFFVVLLPLNVDKFLAAVICFGLNSGAYVAEIVRGGITSVDKGQIEAGRSLGFNYVQTMFHFVIPQAFKAILPALANEFITLLKESSVAFYIGIADLTQGGLKIRSVTYSNFMPLIAVALIYLALVMVLTKLVSILERRLAKSDH